MKIACALILAVSALAADPPKKEAEPPPVITADDREPLHEAEEALQVDQTQAALGQAAEARIPDRKKAVDAAFQFIKAKCGVYGLRQDEGGRINCGKVKPPEPPQNPVGPNKPKAGANAKPS